MGTKVRQATAGFRSVVVVIGVAFVAAALFFSFWTVWGELNDYVGPNDPGDKVEVVTVFVAALAVFVQAVGGAALLLNLRFSQAAQETAREQLNAARDQLTTAQEGQRTERYGKAVEMLASGKGTTELGGIYALERLARSSAADHGPIFETLSAHLRERLDREDEPRATPEPLTEALSKPFAPAEVQAVLDVFRRREVKQDAAERREPLGLNLSRANLRHGTLVGATLRGVDLRKSRAEYLGLWKANLSPIDPREKDPYGNHARLEEAWLRGADFTDADLTCAHFDGAKVQYADFKRANLRDADFRKADLAEARNLKDANLSGTDFEGADLRNAEFGGADLSEARNLTSAQAAEAYMDDHTRMPAGVERSAKRKPKPAS